MEATGSGPSRFRPKSLPTYHGGHGSKHGEESLGHQGDEVSEVSEVSFFGAPTALTQSQGADTVGKLMK